MIQSHTTEKWSVSKVAIILLAVILSLGFMFVVSDASVANAAFDKVTVGGGVGDATNLEDGLFADLNMVLMIIYSVAGFVCVACLIYTGIEFSRAQRNISFPESRKNAFVGFGMTLLGGWVIYKANDLATWIIGLSG